MLFTDRMLTALYSGLSQHYQSCQKRGLTAQDAFAEMYYTLCDVLHKPDSKSQLRHLSDEDKANAVTVLNTLFHASPYFQQLPKQEQSASFFHPVANSSEDKKPSQSTTKTKKLQVTIQKYYSEHKHLLDNFSMIDALSRAKQYAPQAKNALHTFTQKKASKKEDKNQKNEAQANTLVIIVVGGVAIAAVLSALFATAYLLNAVSSDIERLVYHEGVLQASINLMGMAISAAASAFLAQTFLSAPLAALAVSAGLSNPVGLAILGVVAITLIGAALTHFMVKSMNQKIIEKSETARESMDPSDPYRFKLSDSEMKNLERKGIDPIKVKTAMVALRAHIGSDPIPTFYKRHMTSSHGKRIQHLLNEIRELKQGKRSDITVGQMQFNCKKDSNDDKETTLENQQSDLIYPAT